MGKQAVSSFSILKGYTIKYFPASVPLESSLLQQSIPLTPLPQPLGQLTHFPSFGNSLSSSASQGL